jgi:hypothetical protein
MRKKDSSEPPAPIVPLRGGWTRPSPQPIRIPTEWPLFFPVQLKPRCEVVPRRSREAVTNY